MGILQEFRDFVSSFGSAGISDFLPGLMLAPSESGTAVTEMTAIQIAAVSACIRVLSQSFGMLPCNVMQRIANGMDMAADHHLYSLLHDAPNDEYTAADFWMTLEVHRALTGNAYAELVRDNGGRVRELWIRSPFRTFPYRVAKTAALVYKTTDTYDGQERVILSEDMLHIKNFGIDPWVGLSPVRYHMREVFGAAIATQNYGSRFFANDAHPGGVLTSPDVLQPDRKLALANTWTAAHSRSGSHSMAILDGGLKWETISVPPEEAQFIASRQMQREDIAAMYGVPPHFVGVQNAERSANLEQKFLEFLTITLRPNIARYEAEINSKLFSGNVGRNAGKHFVKFDTTAFERADFATTLKALQVGRYAGLYTIDEGRRILGLNPVDPKQLDVQNPGGSLWQPVNMLPISTEEPELPAATGAPASPAEPQEPGAQPGATTPAPPAQEAKSLFPIFIAQFRDAIGRISARKKVDARDFDKVFTPVLTSIASAYTPVLISTDDDMLLPESLTTMVRSHRQGIQQRSSSWDKNNLDKVAADELRLALTAIVPTTELEE